MDDGPEKPTGISRTKIHQLLAKQKRSEPALIVADDIYASHAKQLLDLLDEKVDSVSMGTCTLVVAKRQGQNEMYVKPTEGFVPCGWISRDWLHIRLRGNR